MRSRHTLNKPYFFSDELKKKLSQIPNYPLTFVEAPSGFGKTTAVREYLSEIYAENITQHWYTCLNEPATIIWRGLCSLISQADSQAAANLLKVEKPSEDSLPCIFELLQGLKCRNETYLIIDNYHIRGFEFAYELLNLFSMHGNPKLHFIFISQQLVIGKTAFFYNVNINYIESSSFLISREGTLNLFKNHGIRLSSKELDTVCRYTEGWVAAVLLQIMNYKATGSLHQTADIEAIIENTVWNRLDNEAKEFLLSLSVFNSFSLHQAIYMSGKETLSEEQLYFLKHEMFIRYTPEEDLFTLHSVLHSFLKTQLNALYSTEARTAVLRKAGQACEAEGKLYQAAQFYLSVRDYDALLALPFDIKLFANQKDKFLLDLIEAVINQCPTEIMRRYPYPLIILAYPFLYEQKFDTLAKICNIVSDCLEKNSLNMDISELNNIKGDFLLMKSYITYANISQMHERRKEAYALFQGESKAVTKDIPWTIGCSSPLFQFWSEQGQLKQMLIDLDLSLPPYVSLTKGHCAGLGSLTKAEAALMSGNDNEAESFTYKAIYEASDNNQISICIATEFVTARIAILRGNINDYQQAVDSLKKYAAESSVLYIQKMSDFALASLSLLLGITDSIPRWFCSLSSISNTLYAPSIPYAQTLYATILLYENKFNEFSGISGIILDTAEKYGSLMAKAYHLCQCAYVSYKSGKMQEAKYYLKQALDLTLPDNVYLPIARYLPHIYPVYDSIKDSITDKDGLTVLTALSKKLQKGIDKIKKSLVHSKSPLTPREREVALYAQQRFSAKDIAKILFISDATVRTILRNVYSKLNIHSKSDLYSMDL